MHVFTMHVACTPTLGQLHSTSGMSTHKEEQINLASAETMIHPEKVQTMLVGLFVGARSEASGFASERLSSREKQQKFNTSVPMQSDITVSLQLVSKMKHALSSKGSVPD